jgi:hypothetical protein
VVVLRAGSAQQPTRASQSKGRVARVIVAVIVARE